MYGYVHALTLHQLLRILITAFLLMVYFDLLHHLLIVALFLAESIIHPVILVVVHAHVSVQLPVLTSL